MNKIMLKNLLQRVKDGSLSDKTAQTTGAMGSAVKGLTMLNSCSPGVAVVNIDNGFGADYIASIINRG